MKKYTFKFKHGIDDLLGLSAFVGSWGQGDHYSSNDAGAQHPSYVSYVFDVPRTQQEIDKEVERRKKQNANYIEELKSTGRYGSEYEQSISMVSHPLFDDIKPYETKLSAKMFIFNLGDENNGES